MPNGRRRVPMGGVKFVSRGKKPDTPKPTNVSPEEMQGRWTAEKREQFAEERLSIVSRGPGLVFLQSVLDAPYYGPLVLELNGKKITITVEDFEEEPVFDENGELVVEEKVTEGEPEPVDEPTEEPVEDTPRPNPRPNPSPGGNPNRQ